MYIWGGIFAIVLIIALICIDKHNKKKQQILESMSMLEHLSYLLATAEGYANKVNTVKNAESRKTNLESAISILQQAIQEFPRETHLPAELEKLKAFRAILYTEIAEESIEKCMDKARTAKTVASQVNQASSALAVIEGALREEYTNKDRLRTYQSNINEFISQVQLSDYESKAERLAMKGQFSKAADACLDAIFHLKNDKIDDAEQVVQFQELEERLKKFKEQAEKAQAAKRSKGKQTS